MIYISYSISRSRLHLRSSLIELAGLLPRVTFQYLNLPLSRETRLKWERPTIRNSYQQHGFDVATFQAQARCQLHARSKRPLHPSVEALLSNEHQVPKR
jgi:hypothetical protein